MREDWIEIEFKDIVDKIATSNYKVKQKDYLSAGDFPIIDQGQELIGGYENDEKKVLKCDLPLVVFGDHTRCVKFINFRFIPGADGIKVLVPKFFLNPKYLFYVVNVLSNKIENKGYARHYQLLEKQSIALPPLPEQRAIVKKLESLFSSLDAGVADLKKAQHQLKIYKQAVLKKAFEGKLTNKAIKNDLPKRWKIVKITDLVDKDKNALKAGPFGSSLKKEFYTNDGYKIYGQEQVIKSNPYYGDYYVDEQKYNELYSCRVRPNDILISLVGTVGKVLLLPNDCLPGIINPRLVKITLDLKKYLPLFFKYYFESAFVKSFYSGETRGTTMDVLNLGIIKTIPFPLPHLDEQKEVIKQIESRLSVCDSIEQNIKESLVKAEALRQSILKKAFEGNLLTAQELAECKKAADYEPASILLERIKTEQNQATAKPSKKKVAQPVIVATIETPVAKISADIHAGLIAKVIKIHEENPASIDNLSHIKCEKIAHLVEYHSQIPLGRQPVKDAAGPDDYPHLKKIEHRAKMANYFALQKRDIGYSYSSAKNSDKAIEKFQSALSVEKNKRLDDLIALFLNFDLEVSEIIATTYAGWNNLILNGNGNPSDEEIVYESRENWSERKLKIARERFFKAIEWMRKNEIVPTGYGAVVPFPKKKK